MNWKLCDKQRKWINKWIFKKFPLTTFMAWIIRMRIGLLLQWSLVSLQLQSFVNMSCWGRLSCYWGTTWMGLQYSWSFDRSDDGTTEWVGAGSILRVACVAPISFFSHAVTTGCISVNETQWPLHFRLWAKHSNKFCVIRDVSEQENFVKDYPLFLVGEGLNKKHQHGGLAIFLYVYKSVSYP